MAAELEKSCNDLEINLIAAGKGIFDVTVDDELIYSKYKTGRFPEAGEVIKLLR